MLRICALVLVGIAAHDALAKEQKQWPKVVGDAANANCQDARVLAQHMFYSTARFLYAPLSFPAAMQSSMVLGASDVDISGGSPLSTMEEGPFARLESPLNEANAYWQKTTSVEKRLVLYEHSYGWRGNYFSLYEFAADLSFEQVSQQFSNENSQRMEKPILSSVWRPPLIFKREDSAVLWFIDVEASPGSLANWVVYSYLGNAYEKACELHFRPSQKRGIDMLPMAVGRLETLLDETMGPGNDEGTLQSTARRRRKVDRVWSHIALRPWALSESDTYNSRAEVDSGLQSWAALGPKAQAVHAKILKQYPLAERALAAYLQQQFRMDGNKAKEMATWSLDIAMRAHYAFSNGGDYFRYDNVNTNPLTP